MFGLQKATQLTPADDQATTLRWLAQQYAYPPLPSSPPCYTLQAAHSFPLFTNDGNRHCSVNNFGDSGALAFAEALKKNNSLNFLK